MGLSGEEGWPTCTFRLSFFLSCTYLKKCTRLKLVILIALETSISEFGMVFHNPDSLRYHALAKVRGLSAHLGIG